MQKTTISRIAMMTTLAALLAGCGSTARMGDARDQSMGRMDRAGMATESLRGRDALRGGGVQVSEGVFMAATEERANATALLPARVQAPGAVVLRSRDNLSLSQITERLTQITGIKHVASLGPVSGGENALASSPAAQISIAPEYRGSLSEVLNEISKRFDVEWTYQDEQIVFRDHVTRQYQISSIPSTISGGSSVGSMSSSFSTDFWSEIEASIASIAGENATITIGRGTGLVTVTGLISDQNRIKNYVKEINGSLSQQIAFDVNVLTVSFTNNDGLGIDIQTLFENSGPGPIRRFGATSAGGITQATGSVNIAILEGDIGISAVMQALSREGKVSVETRTGVTTTNNRAVPVQVIDSIAYISGSTIEQQDNGNSIIVPQPATQETGFDLQLFPRILNTREVMVEYSVNLSELQNLQTFGTGAQLVQLPEVSRTSFNQQAVLQNGQTLVMAGFERSRVRYEESRGLSGFFSGGGTREATTEKVATVIMIRPRLLRANRAITAGN